MVFEAGQARMRWLGKFSLITSKMLWGAKVSVIGNRRALVPARTCDGNAGYGAAGGAQALGPAQIVRSVFVAPDVQARGIGRLLMAAIERAARERNIAVLAVPSSVTAETFYA